jgi:hypothetical protein
MATAPTAQLTPSQQAYYDKLVSTPGSNAETQRQYVSSLNDYQALASLDAVSGNAGREGTGAGTSGYDASKVLANAYGISGPITMGSGVSVQSPVAPAVPAYFQANPDVAAAYANRLTDPNLASTANWTPEQFAATHYREFGSGEQRAAPTYTQAQVDQLARDAAAQAGGTISYADAITAARGYGIPEEMVNKAMSTGVITGSAPNYEQMVRDAYAGIGRTGIGTETSNIDQAGLDYWVDTLKSGASTPEAFNRNFRTAVTEYLAQKPEDQYSTYVADYLQKNNDQDFAGVQQLYKDVLGRDADAGGLGGWYKQFGSEISPEERATFEAAAKPELDNRVKSLYTDFLGRTADDEGLDYWKKQFGSSIDDAERETFRQSAAAEVNKQFGVTDPAVAPTTEGVLSGFKYIKDSGIDEAKLKKTLGEDVFNTYKSGFSDYAKTGIANILSDGKLSFDEARQSVKFGRDYGYDAKKLAELTGTNQKVFDAIDKSYEDTTNKIVDSVLGAEDVKTNGDRVVRSLALQQKYGFTDEDLAKAADYDVNKLKADLDPVRNYEADYKKTLTKPDVSGKDLLSFLEESKKNEGIGALFGSNIDGQIAKLKELDEKWSGFKDGYQAENIYNQVTGITKAAEGKNWSGSWMGGGDNAAKEAVRVLMNKGVDSLSDLGVENNFRKSDAGVQYTANGVPVVKDGDNYYRYESFGEGGNQIVGVDPKDVKAVYGKSVNQGYGEDSYSAFVPLTKDELATYDPKTSKFDEAAGKKLIDKSTGKVISTSESGNNFILDRYETGNFFKSKDKTMGVMMTDKGVPVPYQTTEKGGLVYSPVFPIIASMLLPGVGSAVSGMLPGAGVAASGATAAIAPTMLNTALTQGILGGGMAALTGQDVLKGAILGGIGAPISAGIGSLLPAGLSENATNAIKGAGTNVVKGALQGGDFGDLLGQGVLSGLTNYGLGEATKGLNLTPQQLNLATGIALPLAQGKNINPASLIGSMVKTEMQQTKKAAP